MSSTAAEAPPPQPRSITVPVEPGATSVSFTIPPGVNLDVESVYATIDNSGGGDVKPVLSVADQSGVVIAAKRQGETIPAGDTGSATWALRLADEQGSGSGSDFVFLGETVLAAPGRLDVPITNQTFRHLRLEMLVRCTGPGNSNLFPAFNYAPGNALHNMRAQVMFWNVNFTPGAQFPADTLNPSFDGGLLYIANDSQEPSDPNAWSQVVIEVPYYTQLTYKGMTITTITQTIDAADGVQSFVWCNAAGVYLDIAPLTLISFLGSADGGADLIAGSRASLYGIR